ncbi:MAG: S8/S53 family peptidase [Phycisphaerales bacterium]|nr:S8/S53 family peptidase [Phycisphaerales bacterium]
MKGLATMQFSSKCIAITLLLFIHSVPVFADTLIEVDVDGTFTSLDKAIVPTANPTIRITRDVDVPPDFSVLLTREDNRAGIGGAGKSISVGAPGSGADLEETGVGTEVYEGSIPILTGVNTIRIQPNGGGADLLAATMLNYSNDYEDVNGNGALDTGEDTDHDRELDVGEDVNGNNELDIDEDFNNNGILDAGEDLNGNEFLDYNEDLNINGQLDVSEDLDTDGQLDQGEDLNFNGILDFDVALPVDAMIDPNDLVAHPDGFDEQATTLTLAFDPTASDIDVANFLRTIPTVHPFDLEPIGLEIDDVTGEFSMRVVTRIVGGTAPHEAARLLHGQAPGDFEFPPPIPPALPLVYALIDPALIVPSVVAGERLPTRLRNGAAPNAGEGYESSGTNGGFDNDGNSPDELDIAWPHFFIQTFAAHRLIDLLPFRATPRSVCVIDTGFGNGSAALPDIPGGRILNPHDHNVAAAGGAARANLNGVRDGGFATAPHHGTQVASLCCGDGTQFVLGTARRSPLRPIRTNYTTVSLNNSLRTAANHARTSVINCSWRMSRAAPNAATGRSWVRSIRTGLQTGLQRAFGRGKIVVVCAGNLAQSTELDFPAVFTVPARSGTAINDDLDAATDEGPFARDPAENRQAIGAGATGVVNSPRGPERYASSFSSTGTRLTMTAPGQGVISLNAATPYAFSGPINGCSFASPLISGAIIELINVAEALPNGLFSGGGVTRAQANQRVADIVMATADDLGTTSAAAGDRTNNDAGNGGVSDNNFGFGRLNMWKAALSVANQGLSTQHGRPNSGNDTTFTNIPVITEADTKWYGFEIVTSERHASVWIDGTQLADAGATIPNAPNITAYKGIRSDLRIERGVHNLTDGSKNDPAVAGPPARPGQVVEEDPTTGIVPVGTRINDRGQYVMTFSIERKDLFESNDEGNPDPSKPKTLSIRRRGKGVGDRPIFNLRLETTKMRTGVVTGVTFDDFVFTVTPPDYGDATKSPTLLSEDGARHENSNFEWLGRLNAPNIKSVTPEHNADKDDTTGGDAEVDVDGVDNRHDFHDRDGRDDGVLFFPLTYKTAAGNPGKVRFTIGTADSGSPRYSAADPDKSLFVNLWIDWDADGKWEENNSEHVLNGVRIRPVAGGGAWQVTNQGTSGSVTAHQQNGADNNSARFESQIPVGAIGRGLIWARMRLDYGENVGQNDPLPQFESLRSMRSATGAAGLTKGAARYGEVEDYLVGSDFGDAPDPFTAPGSYPTKKVNAGARHLDMHKEWLGPDNNMRPQATREIDADDLITDEDIVINLVDKDKLCDGVVIPPIVPGQMIDIEVTVTSSISARGAGFEAAADVLDVSRFEDAADSLPRYGVVEPLRRLYLSGWADWNDCDGNWAPAEKIVDDIIFPDLFGADGKYTLGELYTDTNKNGVCDNDESFTDRFGIDTKTFTYSVMVPEDVCCPFYFRFRLAYGEDEATVDLEVKEADEDGRANVQEKGGALMGEVEDYPAVIYKVWDYIYTPIQDTVFSPSVWTKDGVPIGESFPESDYPGGPTPIPTIPLEDHRIVPTPPNDWHWDVTYTPPGHSKQKQFIVWMDRFGQEDLMCVEVVCPPPVITTPVMLMVNVETDSYQLTDDFGVIYDGQWSQYPDDIPPSLNFQPTGIMRCNTLPCFCPGDVDGSGFVDTDDMIPFVEELLIISMNDCADVNRDGRVTGSDIQAFADLLLSGGGSECVFEPRGACCLPDTLCIDGVTIDGCFALQGTYQGDDSDCAVPCVLNGPPHDDCEQAQPVIPFKPIIDQNVDATDDNAPICQTAGPIGRGLWYIVTGTGNVMTATTCSPITDFDTMISVYCDCQNPVCVAGNNDDNAGPPECDLFGQNLKSTVSWCTVAGQPYFLLVGGFQNEAGTFELFIDDGPTCVDPVPCFGGK